MCNESDRVRQWPLPVTMLIATVAFLTTAIWVWGQYGLTPVFAQAAFDVVSIKPTPAGPLPRSPFGFQPGGRFVMHNVTSLRLIQLAFHEPGQTGLSADQVDTARLPTWVTQSHFDIEARAAEPTADLTMEGDGAQMVQAMLADRFQLKSHFESRELPVWALLVAKNGGLGPTLHRVAVNDCDIPPAQRGSQAQLPTPQPGRPRCALAIAQNTATAGAVTMAILANALRGQLDGPAVIDHTGLDGRFDVDLHWSPPARPGDAGSAATIPEWPSIFTAVQEQLGLKLEKRTEPRDVLIVDRIAPPAPN